MVTLFKRKPTTPIDPATAPLDRILYKDPAANIDSIRRGLVVDISWRTNLGKPRLIVVDNLDRFKATLANPNEKSFMLEAIEQGGENNAPTYGLRSIDPATLPAKKDRIKWLAESMRCKPADEVNHDPARKR